MTSVFQARGGCGRSCSPRAGSPGVRRRGPCDGRWQPGRDLTFPVAPSVPARHGPYNALVRRTFCEAPGHHLRPASDSQRAPPPGSKGHTGPGRSSQTPTSLPGHTQVPSGSAAARPHGLRPHRPLGLWKCDPLQTRDTRQEYLLPSISQYFSFLLRKLTALLAMSIFF